MNLRNINKYQVHKVNTVGMTKSAIPQMTNYLYMKNKETKAQARNKAK